MRLDDKELRLIVADGNYPLKEYKAKAIAEELLRLRGFLKEFEYADDMGRRCRFCTSNVGYGHGPECPAFTESGEVK